MPFAGLALILTALVAAQQPARIPTTPSIEGASSGAHIWFAAPDLQKPEEIRLYHHAVSMDGPYYRTPAPLTSMPVAIAAHGDSAWLVFDPRPNDPSAGRDVYTLRAERNLASGIFFYIPDSGPKLLEALPGGGVLAGFTAGPQGPVALLVPPVWAEAGVENDPPSARVANLAAPRLLALRSGDWVDLPPPTFEPGVRAIGLVAIGSDGELLIVAHRRTGQRQVILCEQNADESWTIIPTDIESGRIEHLSAQGMRIVLASPAPTAGVDAPAILDIGFLREGSLLPLASLTVGRDGALVVGTERDIRIFRATRAAELFLQTADPLTGRISEPVAMTGQPLSTASRVYFPLLVTVFTIALLLAILVRPASSRADKAAVAPAVDPAPLATRGMGLLLDLAPAAFLAMKLTGSELSDLFNFPLWAATLEESMPVIIAAALTGLHCAVGEAIWGTSIGKGLVGLRVVALDGSKPRLWQALVRNLFKIICTVMPPLAVLALLNPYRQRLGDAVARTIVTTVPEESPSSPPPDDSAE